MWQFFLAINTIDCSLFNESFYKNCNRILKPNGVFSAQTESPETFEKLHIDSVKLIRKVFKYADPLYGNVPMYPSGLWSWTFASMETPRYLNPLRSRINQIDKTCTFWSPRWQEGAFNSIPAKLDRKLNQ